jgi:hypothetical protein
MNELNFGERVEVEICETLCVLWTFLQFPIKHTLGQSKPQSLVLIFSLSSTKSEFRMMY